MTFSETVTRNPERCYGNTQAHVLDYYNSGSFADVIANRVLDVKERRIAQLATMLEMNDYSDRRPAGCKEPWKVLRKYTGYKKLYGERLHASNYPPTTSDPKVVEFGKLPGELRNRVYRLLLVMKPAIDLVPKSSEDDRRTPKYASKSATQRYYKLKPILRLLRLNKDINAEASDIFYGENEFRFTNGEGWFFLRAFLETIGKANTARLRHIAVHTPWEGVSTDEYSRPQSTGPYFLETYLSSRGLSVEGATSSLDPIPQSLNLLSTAGTLAKLDLILPFSFEVSGLSDIILDRTRFARGLKVKLVHLRKDGFFESMDTTQCPMLREFDDEEGATYREAFTSPKTYAIEMGWEYELVQYDFKGRYPPWKGDDG